MRTLFVSALLCLLLSVSVVAQTKKTDREHDGLKGPVRSVRVEIEHFKEDGKSDEHGRHLSRATTYNRDGNKLEDETFYAYGRISYGKHVLTYDAKGRKIEDAKYQNGQVAREAFTYEDQPPAPLSNNTYWVNQVKFDSEGRIAEVTRKEENGRLFGRRVFKYQDGSRVVRQESYDSEGHPSGVLIETFNDQGRLLTQVNDDDTNARYFTRLVFSYDEWGNERKYEVYGNKGVMDVATFSAYEFDSHGNWVKRMATFERPNQAPYVEVSYRTITYFDEPSPSPKSGDTKSQATAAPANEVVLEVITVCEALCGEEKET